MMSTNGSPAPAALESTWSQNQRHYQTWGLVEMLTRKQYELLRFISDRLKESGVPPSFDEMKDALDLRSKSGIHRLITALEERGFIRRLPNRARAIEVIKLPELSAGGNGRRGFTPSVIEGALIDEEEATLKRFRRRGASIALEPANTSYEVRILPPNRVKIQGKLIGLYRKY